jgi:lysophospholipase L1-like esterase
MLKKVLGKTLLAVALCGTFAAHADQPWTFANNTRYLAMGDSLTAGYGATPMTNGYAYQLYEEGAYDAMTNTIFANAAVPGATSAQVLAYQVPLATQSGFAPQVITMTVGGNDLFAILAGADPLTVLFTYQGNLASILGQLCVALPGTRIYVANLYSIQNFPVPVEPVIQAFNQVVAGVAAFSNATTCGGRVKVADVYSEFAGNQNGLLLINRNGASPDQVHPSNAGHRAIEKAFLAAR